MMKNFNAKSNIVLSVLLLLSILSYLAVENSKVKVRQRWYTEKLRAATLTKDAVDYLKNFRLNNGIFIDVVNDPNETALIGQEYSMITTDRGDINSKLSTMNPNFAAAILDMLKEAGLKKGDKIGIACTGSFPGLNIAVLAAVEVLELKPIIITSVGSSNFGANDPYFTWLDMENYLYQNHVFSNKSIAASIGGGNDRGRGLSPEGRDLLINAIKRNKVEFIDEHYLDKSIDKRMEIYSNQKDSEQIKAYINVGGGIASLGSSINGKLIPSGLTTLVEMHNYPVSGVIVKMAKQNIPIIHLLNIRNLLEKYNLPFAPVPLPEPGEGDIFYQLKYNVVVAAIISFILLSLIIAIYIFDNKRHKLGNEVVYNSNTKSNDLIKLKNAI